MSEIPEDVRKTVDRAMFALNNQPADGTRMPGVEEMLALAILNERERCAKVCEQMPTTTGLERVYAERIRAGWLPQP